ncbi:pre-RNA processing PIH1/Nop17-domain-containing protein, partial [Ganoderma leucocontextum]
DSNVPPPPHGTDAAIDRAIADTSTSLPEDADQWFVPLIVSDPRTDSDKASVVFDCIFNSTLKSRVLRSDQFKTFLIELAFQRIEAQYSLLLSRQIGTPNIASKGKLHPRSVLVPTSLYQSSASTSKPAGAPLIEELPASAPSSSAVRSQPPKGILKTGSSTTSQAAVRPKLTASATANLPELSWSPTDDGQLRIALTVPHLTRASMPDTTLDLEPRRLIFVAPDPAPYALDLDLLQPDADIQKLFGDANKGDSALSALRLKRERRLDVDRARAEWHVAEGQLIIYA